MVALISIPLALSQTPAYTAKTADTGPVHHAVCPFTPRRIGRYQIILLGDRLGKSFASVTLYVSVSVCIHALKGFSYIC